MQIWNRMFCQTADNWKRKKKKHPPINKEKLEGYFLNCDGLESKMSFCCALEIEIS